MVAPQAAAKGLSFELKTEGRLPQYIRADAKRLRQILINLLSNAVRFTERGGIVLRLDLTREVARIQVIDTGIGIAEQDLERIFMPFERGSAGRRNGEPGTGLGLTITHLLTQLMGGELTVQSAPGQGSTFTVRLYLSEVSAPAQRTLITHRPVTGYLGPRRHLLVVDDHPTQRQMLAGLLLPLGFLIREAASGSECLESVLHEAPDAVLLDITMDDMDGWDTARRLRTGSLSDRPDVPIIMVSANAFENRADKLAEAGAQAFVDKPVIESELLTALQKHLQLEWVAELPVPGWAAARLAPPAVSVGITAGGGRARHAHASGAPGPCARPGGSARGARPRAAGAGTPVRELAQPRATLRLPGTAGPVADLRSC
jgi:CheY-like chemotaxis protein/anti-sigma regulatory factor (Ser/Thr protein kinase)